MKTILLLVSLCLPALATPLPPPPVKRPAPLLSPSHASALKHKPMAKVTKASVFTSASVTKAGCTVVLDHNFFGCETNDPTCVLYDVIHVTFPAPSGAPVTIEWSEDLDGWMWVAQYGEAPYVRDVNFEWHLPASQRAECGFFRLVRTPVSGFAPASAGAIRINPNFKGVRAWATRK